MTEQELKQLAVDKVRECKQLALSKLKFQMLPITVKFKLADERAGVAYTVWKNCRIESTYIDLNFKLLVKHTQETLTDTIPHEIAHLLADQYYNAKCGHDRRWEHILLDVYGVKPQKYHTMVKGWVVRCGICNHEHYGLKEYLKIQIENKPTSFLCDNCGNFFSNNTKFYLTSDTD